MTRPLRIEFEGALYHITSRGNARQKIFQDKADRYLFLNCLAQCIDRYQWQCHAFCLMDNHYHLLIETPLPNLSKGMRHLNGSYTQSYNRRYHRVGHLYQGRYKAILVQKESYLLELARYIVLNPVRAEMVRTAREWPWSSYRAMVGEIKVPNWLTIDQILSQFTSRRDRAMQAYKTFISEGQGQPSPWQSLKNQVFLGDDNFVNDMQSKLPDNFSKRGIPKVQLSVVKRPLEWYTQKYKQRDKIIIMAYKSGHYTQNEIGEYFSISHTTVSRMVRQADVQLYKGTLMT